MSKLPPPVGGQVPPQGKAPGSSNPLMAALKAVLADESGVEDALIAVGCGIKKFKKLRSKRKKGR